MFHSGVMGKDNKQDNELELLKYGFMGMVMNQEALEKD